MSEVFKQNPITSYTVPKILTPEQCQEVKKMATLEGMERSSVLTTDYAASKKSRDRTSSSCWLRQYPDGSNIWLWETVMRAAIDVNDKYYRFNILNVQQLQVLCYGPFQKFKWHFDTYAGSDRKMTCVINLSDAKDYFGGGLQVKGGWEGCEHKREIGAGNYFPSYMEHRARAPWLGKRWVLVAWFTGTPWL